jgi:hypothetical protein
MNGKSLPIFAAIELTSIFGKDLARGMVRHRRDDFDGMSSLGNFAAK